jgi:hypothetical protein
LKSSTAVGGSAGAPFGPSTPDAGRSKRSAALRSSFNVPSSFRISTTPGRIFGCAGTVRVRRVRKASSRVAGSLGASPSTSAGLQTASGLLTSSRAAIVKRSPMSVPGRGKNTGKNGARTAAPL